MSVRSATRALLAVATVLVTLFALAPATATIPEPGVLTGRVVGPDGKPMTQGRVQTYQYDESNGRYTGGYSVQPDAQGRFRLDETVGGRYWVRIVPTNPTWAPEWYDDATTIEGAKPLQLNSTPTEIDVKLGAQSATARAQGVVTDQNGAPIVGARVRFTRPLALGAAQTGEELAAEVKTGTGGRYSTSLPAGSWLVEFDVPGRWAYFHEYYDDAPNYDDAERVVLGDGETKVVHADLRCQSTCPAAPLEDPTLNAVAVGLVRSVALSVSVSGRPATATGTVTARVGSKEKTVTLRQGRATFLVSGVEPGRQPVELFYSGDDNIRSIDAERTVRVW